MDLGMFQEQTQKLIMTQQMKQAIQLLHCTAEELNEVLLTEANQNPLLEYQPPSYLKEISWSTLSRASRSGPRSREGGDWNANNPLEQLTPARKTMVEELEQQLRLMKASGSHLKAALKLAGCLDENGYLDCSREEQIRLCGSQAAYEAGLRLLQQCDPPGIGAANLQECLLLQAQALVADIRPVVLTLIHHHLEDVAAGRLQQISRTLGLPVETVQLAIDVIRSMNPRPGATLASDETHYVVPEVVVRLVGDSYQVFLNEDSQPKVMVNQGYLRLLQTAGGDAVKYMHKQNQSANWLIKSLEQRNQTLYRVSTAIVQVQQQFFDVGPRGLQPLTLQQVASIVQLHESTVSRTVRGKFMQTPRGVYELKYFFSAELGSKAGGVSAESVKHLIRQMVAAEDAHQPLSDETLCQQLVNRGIQVSRRTIAKYRDELHIPSSSKRRRFA